jgi:hypothetical protein
MKFFITLLFIVVFSGVNNLYAQVEDPDAPPTEVIPQDDEMVMPPAQDVVPPAAAPGAAPDVAAPAKKVVVADGIKGNARNSIQFTESKEKCGNGLKSMALTNTSATRPLKAKIDIEVSFSGVSGGHISKKSIIVDNLMMNETRIIGCGGCVSHRTGKTCTVYKIVAAVFK